MRLDDGVPDYAGVGNICSIDSGLWVIIAFYNYITKTRDLDFLRRYAARLQLAMMPKDADAEAMAGDLSEMERMLDEYLDFARGDVRS